jgi:hypothetical protein
MDHAMKSPGSRLFAMVVMALLAWIALLGANTKPITLQPDKLIILSTTDVKGKLAPCG